jgi:hypothetical protein
VRHIGPVAFLLVSPEPVSPLLSAGTVWRLLRE